MNHTPQFSIGQEVVTPRHGTGVVKWVYPAPRPRIRNRYSVIVRRLRQPLMLDEIQLKLPAPDTPAPEVCCRDCGQNPKALVRSSILCPVINQYRKVEQPRICKHFTPRQSAEGGNP